MIVELAAEAELVDLKIALDSLEQTSFHITKAMIDATLARHATRMRR